MYIYENEATGGLPIACNDDWCTGPNYPYEYLSYLREVFLWAGNTYYIVVDAYGPDCGEYVLRITESTSCELGCPPGAEEEGEQRCFEGYADHFNGGCSSDPPAFRTVDPAPDLITICGFSGTSDPNPPRDEDWYEISPADTSTITFCCTADFPALVSLLDGDQGCVKDIVIDHVATEACEHACLTETVASGTYWLRIFPLFGGGVPCSSRYALTIEGYDGTVTAASPPIRSSVDSNFHGGFPNPFAEATTIRYTIAASGAVSLRIVDVSGRLVRVLVNAEEARGDHDATWDGRDDAGRRVADGMYFVRLTADDISETRKVVFLSGK